MLCETCKGKLWAQKQKQAFIDKYGVDNPMKLPGIADKIQETMQDRYGEAFAMRVPEFKQKFIDTCTERYGTSYFVNHADFIEKSSCKSKINEKFAELLAANNIPFEMEKECDDKRFDFKLQHIRTYIEIDPSYTHNVAGNHWEPDGLPKTQQLIKTLIAEKHGYRCIHVFDWDDWSTIIELIKPVRKIFARSCEVRVFQDDSYNKFIDDNHIQKSCKGTKLALGLYFQGELVQVMTFGKPRYNKNYTWELLRLCTKKGLAVTGGASKLFSYATKTAGITSIISYCDRAKFTGQVYKRMGMTLLRESAPQEVWSKGSAKVTSSLLRQRGYDQLFDANYGKGTSNEELMLKDGWLPVYDCGQLVFTYGQPIAEEHLTDVQHNINYSALLKTIDKKKERLCKFCGKPFVPATGGQIYCKRPHYMTCPVCGKQYLVTNNDNLKRPPVACSYECRRIRREETSLKKYGIRTPGNNPEAREKTKQTLLRKYGVDSALKDPEIRKKAKQTLIEKYGVDNIGKSTISVQKSQQTRAANWLSKVHELLPYKFDKPESYNKFKIDDNIMKIYLLNERASVDFLKQYGFRLVHKFGRIHMSVGLVNDGQLYQVLRFERMPNNGGIRLVDFGTKSDWYNPNGYSKLMEFATKIRGIEEFVADIPRYIGNDRNVIRSLNLECTSKGEYKVYWIMEDKSLKELTNRDNIEEMKLTHEYITSDWIDKYRCKPSTGGACNISEVHVLS